MNKRIGLSIFYAIVLFLIGIYETCTYFFGVVTSDYSLDTLKELSIVGWGVSLASFVLFVLSVYFLFQRFKTKFKSPIIFVSWYVLFYFLAWIAAGTVIFVLIYGREIGVANAIGLAARFDIIFFILHIVFGAYLLFILFKDS